ncbi:hypothetical protein SAMN05216326_12544 [Nitrosomonas marina]|uniref:Uncharacterized protein n=1 Tax=Nitrosomonas marina TaxID=917 RepID=A0A1I0E6Z7_9PROT|nr:hypothetical protein [Nitrosomonas marina]SET40946.1 hypothetical protein SAMN05216326_12544 [Nitrosomonas marina]
MSALPKEQEFKKPSRKPVPVFMRVIQGGFVPADATAEQQLRDKKFKIGDVVKVFVRKLRSGKFNRKVHRIGQLCVEHIDDFKHMDAHSVLKRLQLEGNIYCDEIAVRPSGIRTLIPREVIKTLKPVLELFGLKLTDTGLLIVRIPRSLSFESMDQAEYEDAARKMCDYISEVYWRSLESWQIEEMADSFVDH